MSSRSQADYRSDRCSNPFLSWCARQHRLARSWTTRLQQDPAAASAATDRRRIPSDEPGRGTVNLRLTISRTARLTLNSLSTRHGADIAPLERAVTTAFALPILRQAPAFEFRGDRPENATGFKFNQDGTKLWSRRASRGERNTSRNAERTDRAHDANSPRCAIHECLSLSDALSRLCARAARPSRVPPAFLDPPSIDRRRIRVIRPSSTPQGAPHADLGRRNDGMCTASTRHRLEVYAFIRQPSGEAEGAPTARIGTPGLFFVRLPTV